MKLGTDILGTTTSAKWSDLYDATSAGMFVKTLLIRSVVIYDREGEEDITTYEVLDYATKEIKISDEAPKASIIDGKTEFTATPDQGKITVDSIEDYKVKDQYGVEIEDAVKTYRVTDIAENADAYAANSFKVSNNDGSSMSIAGAERGDKFTLIVKSGGAELKVTVTVGADSKANISENYNTYLKELIPVLEERRQAGLN